MSWDAVAPAIDFIALWLGRIWAFASGASGSFVVLGLVLLLLFVDAERLVRLWRGLWFKARRTVSDQVWINEESAVSLMNRSQWGQLIGPYGVDASVFNFDSVISRLHPRVGLSDVEKARLKFRLFLKKTLTEFAAHNPTAYRMEGGKESYDEVALRKFLAQALDNMIDQEFGQPPSFKVT